MELVEVFIEIAICHSMVDLMTSCHVTDRTSRTEFRLSDQNSKTSSSNSNELLDTLERFDISLEIIWLYWILIHGKIGIGRKFNLSKVLSSQIRFSIPGQFYFFFPFGLEFSVEVSWLTNHKNQSRVEFCHQTNSSFRELIHV